MNDNGIGNKAERTQVDGKQLDYSVETAIMDWDESKTRQEFAADADVNNILNRFGVDGTRTPVYGEYDFTLDLQTAMASATDAQEAWAKMPDSVRRQYPTWQELLNASANGSLEQFMKLQSEEASKALREQKKREMAQEDELRLEVERDKARAKFEKDLLNGPANPSQKEVSDKN